MALWFFQRKGPGEIQRIALPSMQRFLAGEQKLPADGDGFVRCIGVSVELHRRKPSTVGRVWFSKIRVDEEGRIDPHHRPELVRVAKNGSAPGFEGPLIPAHHRFAERRLSHLIEWRPEQVDVDALRAAVNLRAKKGLL
ncbi:MAG: hypothetical protein NVS2B9_04870 [Myxococcales bacterium]